MSLSKELLSVLACPACKGPVLENPEGLVCEKCRVVFSIQDGIPVMVIDQAKPFRD